MMTPSVTAESSARLHRPIWAMRKAWPDRSPMPRVAEETTPNLSLRRVAARPDHNRSSSPSSPCWMALRLVLHAYCLGSRDLRLGPSAATARCDTVPSVRAGGRRWPTEGFLQSQCRRPRSMSYLLPLRPAKSNQQNCRAWLHGFWVPCIFAVMFAFPSRCWCLIGFNLK